MKDSDILLKLTNMSRKFRIWPKRLVKVEAGHYYSYFNFSRLNFSKFYLDDVTFNECNLSRTRISDATIGNDTRFINCVLDEHAIPILVLKGAVVQQGSGVWNL